MIINPIFIWIMFIMICVITVQFAMAKEYPMAIVWGGSAICEAGFIWHVMQGGS